MKNTYEMRNILSNIHYFYYDTDYFFKSIRDSNFNDVELYTGTPHIFIDGYVIDDFDKVFETAKKYNVNIVAIHPETLSFRYSLCRLDEEWNRKSLNAYLNNVEFAAEHKCKFVHTDLTGVFRDDNQEDVKKRVADNLNVIGERCKEKGITLVLETAGRDNQGFISTISQLKYILDLVDFDVMVGVNYTALREADETLGQWLDEFDQKIKHVRVSDLKEAWEIKNFLENKEVDIDVIHYPLEDYFLENPTEYNERVGESHGIN